MRHRPERLPEAAAPTGRVGRPARVNSQAIVRAALDIGLDRVTLTQVADRLGVAVSSLYRHVKNRDDLVRMAASRHMLMRRPPAAEASHWCDVAIDYAESLFDSLIAEPQLISELMRGQIAPDAEVDFFEDFLSRICPHGFTPAEGLHLYRALSMITLGGVVGALSMRASEQSPETQSLRVRRLLAERPESDLPLLRQIHAQYTKFDRDDWRQSVRDLLAGIALSRGEAPGIPAAPVTTRKIAARRKKC